MSLFYRVMGLVSLLLAVFLDGQEITHIDRMWLFLFMFIFNITARLIDIENLIKESKNKNI
jgi:hypothetical protein